MSPAPDRDITAAWRDHRPAGNLAYQMLGDVGEAEDAAHSSSCRLSRADSAAIDDIRGWLTVVAGRLCLDQLRSAAGSGLADPGAPTRLRRWTPSFTACTASTTRCTRPARGAATAHPLGERVAFVLHDVFAVPFDEIAVGGPRVRAANWPGAPAAVLLMPRLRRPTSCGTDHRRRTTASSPRARAVTSRRRNGAPSHGVGARALPLLQVNHGPQAGPV